MKQLLIFSGTTEGHLLCRFLSSHSIPAHVYVATAYGEAVMEKMPGITIHTGRLSYTEMAQQMHEGCMVVDATHPYASEVTENIKSACAASGAQYLRLVRPAQSADGVHIVPDTEAAVQWLCQTPGKVLLTTGSKELDAYTAIPDYQQRLYPRVLPTAEVLQKCAALGFPGASILAMQGPFSHEMNVALLHKTGASILVTKDTGKSGGFAEKLSAAREVGVQVLMIARPQNEEGFTLEEMQQKLLAEFDVQKPPRFPLFVSLLGKKVVIVGAGAIAARRIGVLQKFGADIHVIAPEISQNIDLSKICYQARSFQPEDIDGAFLVIAATNDRNVNHEIAALCKQHEIPVSVADCAEESTFYFPAICEGSGLIAGLVSDGSDHHAVSRTAKKIREILE